MESRSGSPQPLHRSKHEEIEMFASAMTFLDRTATVLIVALAASPILGIAARAAFL
jgi:hypothetical protein